MTALTVITSGPLSAIEDRGRHRLVHVGVGQAGAMDRAAHDLANRLVGNAPDDATVEIVFGGAEFELDTDGWVAVTAAWGPITVAGSAVEVNRATLVRAGQRLVIGFATHGIRYYFAVRGGLAVAPVLGSRSWDSLARLGTPPLVAGDVVPIGPVPVTPVPTHDFAPLSPPPTRIEIDVRPGPRLDWFDDGAWDALVDTEWVMSPRSDRSGIRLDARRSGGASVLHRTESGELPSEGMLRGAIQVSPDGSPTVLAADHPLTGGYPVIAVVTDATVDRLAQLRPGQSVRMIPVSGHA